MPNLRDIKRRIKSVKNTTKITRTMELIATAKSQTCMNRIKGSLPYFHALEEISSQALSAGGEDAAVHPLLEVREVKKVAILTVVSNRGLCGGYNGNVMRLARNHRQKLMDEGVEVEIRPSGKKGINWLKFQKIPYLGPGYTQFDDRPRYEDVEEVANTLINLFLKGEVDRVDVVYTHYVSAGRQTPIVETMLPLQPKETDQGQAQDDKSGGKDKAYTPNFLIEPSPKAILDAIFPMQAKLQLFRVYLEAATSEQIARRIAMKNATENATEVSRTLKMAYNRARQSQITNEILEVLGGAEALK